MGDLCGVAADDARDLEVGSSAEGFDGVAADVAVADALIFFVSDIGFLILLVGLCL